MTGKIVCYGDSNTYGYNPATGEKCSTCWVDLIAQHCSGTVVNDGVLGREIPFSDEWLADADQMLIMLGSNDLLDGYSANDCRVRMRRFLSKLPKDRIILIAPEYCRLLSFVVFIIARTLIHVITATATANTTLKMPIYNADESMPNLRSRQPIMKIAIIMIKL